MQQPMLLLHQEADSLRMKYELDVFQLSLDVLDGRVQLACFHRHKPQMI